MTMNTVEKPKNIVQLKSLDDRFDHIEGNGIYDWTNDREVKKQDRFVMPVIEHTPQTHIEVKIAAPEVSEQIVVNNSLAHKIGRATGLLPGNGKHRA